MDRHKTMLEYLNGYTRAEQASFHMPGHKGYDFFEREGYGDIFKRFPDYDITEIAGADNLFKPRGIIKKLMKRYSRYYHAEKSYLLINGSSSGIVAAIMATIKPGEKLIMDRSSHKSAVNGIALAGGVPVYIYPESVVEYGITGEMTAEEVEKALEKNPDAKAVFITSPNYYGICSDIEAISEVVHSKGKILIVDQAHGAHLKGFYDTGRLPFGVKDAERSGADIVVNSIHKTMASFTQTAVINICTGTVSGGKIRDALQMVESSSPSYLMMLSMEMNMEICERRGRKLADEWLDMLSKFREEAKDIKGLQIVNHSKLDPSKLNLDMSSCGITGKELSVMLMERGIYTELHRGGICLAMTGIGNRWEDYQILLNALKDISRKAEKSNSKICEKDVLGTKETFANPLLDEKNIESENQQIAHNFGSSFSKDWEKVHFSFAVGRISARPIIPYPPGIPLIVGGQVIDRKVLEEALALMESGCSVMGIDKKGFVYCYKENY